MTQKPTTTAPGPKQQGALLREKYAAFRWPRRGFAGLLLGLDTDGTPYFDSSLPWVSEDPDGKHVVLDVDIAALHGVAITEETSIVQAQG